MSNHFHLIATTPNANISQCMHQLMQRTSRRLTRAGNRINETYAGRHFKCILQSHNYYLNAYKYNYRNPVTAGICDLVEEYPFSSLRGLLNSSELRFPLAEDLTYSSDPAGTLRWLNQKPEMEKFEAVRWGLKKQYFCSTKNRTTNRYILSENDVM